MLRDNLVGLIEPMFSSAGANPLALCIAQNESSDDRPPCLENPRPGGAESTLTENAASPFHAEPTHTEPKLITQLGGHEATLDAPYESAISSEYFPVEVKQVWVYDLSSGKVLLKRDATARSGARLTGSVALGNLSGSFSGKSFLIDTGDIGVGSLNDHMSNISAWVYAARSKAKKKHEQLEVENSCRGVLTNFVSDARTWFGKSAHALSTNTVQYDGLPPASYQLLVVGRIGSQMGVWSGTAVVSEDTETNIVATQAFVCEDPNGEVAF